MRRSALAAGDRTNLLLLAMIAAVAMLQLHHVFVQGINWDEFFYLSKIYLLREAALASPLQSFHARLFAWLPMVPGTEIEELRVARLAMLACELVTVACIVGIARRFAGERAALVAGLAYIGGGFVFQHGFSFRADPLAAMLLMSALWLLLSVRLGWVAGLAMALLLALAVLVTVKSVFYAPAFAGIALLRLHESDRPGEFALRLAGTTLATVLILAGLYLLHRTGVSATGAAGTQAVLANAAEKMFSMGLLPRSNYILKQALLAPVLAAIIIAAPAAFAARGRERAETFALIGLFLPIGTLLIYRNSFPYFYAFLLPPVIAAAAVAIPPLIRRYGAPPLGTILLLNALLLYFAMPKDMQKVQRDVVRAAHLIFPRPVPYFDFCSMLGSFPQKGFFMTGWGTENYRERGRPLFRDVLAKEAVPLLVANHVGFLDALAGSPSLDPLLAEDAAIIRDNYVHHWGPFWVAGKRISAGADTIEVAVEGPYTLEARPILIDGRPLAVGETVWLRRGSHRVSGPMDGHALLRWGRNLPRPDLPQPQPGVFGIFTDF